VVLPGDAVTGAAGPATVTCERAGRGWRVRLAGRGVVIEDSIGMLHLAVLIGNPRQEIAAADLAAGVAGIAGSPRLTRPIITCSTPRPSPATAAGSGAWTRNPARWHPAATRETRREPSGNGWSRS
jgi:hypothetical protein